MILRERGATIYVLVDALGWEVLRDRPFLDDILQERHRLQTILGYSCGAIPSLLTGQYPDEHGHWNLFYRSPETSPFRWTAPLLRLPRSIREHRVTRRVVKEVSRRVSGYSGYFAFNNLPLDRARFFDICETTDIYRPGGLAPARSIFDRLEQAGIAYHCYNYHQHTDAQILKIVPRHLRESESRVFFLYLAGLDTYLHFHVSDREGVSEKLRWYEEGIRRVYRAAQERWGHARLHIFSDHGMTPIRETRDLIALVGGLGLSVPEDYLPAYDSTMARFWLSSERAEARLRPLLEGLPYGRLLSASEKTELGLAFADDRYGQLVLVMEPGMLICPSDMGRIRFNGMHGFDPRTDPCAYAVFLSTERQTSPLGHVTDVMPRLLEELGLERTAGRASRAAAR